MATGSISRDPPQNFAGSRASFDDFRKISQNVQNLRFHAQQLAKGTGEAWHLHGAGVESRRPPGHGLNQAPRRF